MGFGINMKKIALHFLLFISSFYCFSQTKEDVLKEVKILYDAQYLMDIEKIVALSYPTMVSQFGESIFYNQIDSFYQNEQFRYRHQLPVVTFTLKEFISKNGITISLISYRNPIRYFFEKKLSTIESQEKLSWIKEINSTNEVTFEPNRNSFNVKKTSYFIAVADVNTSNKWKFFNLEDEKQKKFFGKLFPEFSHLLKL